MNWKKQSEDHYRLKWDDGNIAIIADISLDLKVDAWWLQMGLSLPPSDKIVLAISQQWMDSIPSDNLPAIVERANAYIEQVLGIYTNSFHTAYSSIADAGVKSFTGKSIKRTIMMNKENWSGEEVPLDINEKQLYAETPDFTIQLSEYDAELYYALIDWNGDEDEYSVLLDDNGKTWVAKSGSITREADNPYEAVAKLVYTIW